MGFFDNAKGKFSPSQVRRFGWHVHTRAEAEAAEAEDMRHLPNVLHPRKQEVKLKFSMTDEETANELEKTRQPGWYQDGREGDPRYYRHGMYYNTDDYSQGTRREGIATEGAKEQGRQMREKYGNPNEQPRKKFLGIF